MTRTSKALAAVAGSVMLMAAMPAAATWGWWGGHNPHPTYPTNPPSSSGGATQVPEPEMLVMFGLGAAGLLIARRKKGA